MLIAPIPANEEARLLDLYAHKILDTAEDADFNDLVEIAAELCQCPVSLISLIDSDRQWLKAKKGVDVNETGRDISFCGHTITGDGVFMVEDATTDERFADNPLVTDGVKVKFYMGAPIISTNGHALGSICVLDTVPRRLDKNKQQILLRLSRQVTRLLELKLQAKRLEEFSTTITEKNEKYKIAKEEAEKASLVKSRFLSAMSHEIRTPMNAVIGFTKLLSQNANPEQLTYLKVLQYSADNLMSLINDVLDFNKIEEGKMVFENVPFSLAGMLNNVRLSFQQQALDKNLYFNLLMENGLPDLVKGDQVRLGQIINNLAGNALKFTSTGGVSLRVTSLPATSNKVTIRFEITDTGIGIPAAEQEKIFEMFTQASSDTTRKYGGSGLGLAIVKKMLGMLGSTIHLTSVEGRGSSFYFELSFDAAETIELEEPVLSMIPGANKQLGGMRVLLVEDNSINVMLATIFLKRWEITVEVAGNGVEAIEALKKSHFDIVLMDLQMPEMDGIEATRYIRGSEGANFQHVPIIALTASAMMEERGNVLAAGMDDIITKPFLPEILFSKMLEFRLRATGSRSGFANDQVTGIYSRRKSA